MQSVAVYCGSSIGNDPLYRNLAIELADFFVANNIRLVNGGGSIGLMGVMADRMLEKGGTCIGVIPIALKEKEVAHLGMTELIVTPDMHTRKLKMVNLSNAFIAIPGGFGTLDELFETLTWAQLHLHEKPIGVLNVGGYFDHLIHQADYMVDKGFLRPEARALLYSSHDVKGLFEQFKKHSAPKGEKWDYMRDV